MNGALGLVSLIVEGYPVANSTLACDTDCFGGSCVDSCVDSCDCYDSGDGGSDDD